MISGFMYVNCTSPLVTLSTKLEQHSPSINLITPSSCSLLTCCYPRVFTDSSIALLISGELKLFRSLGTYTDLLIFDLGAAANRSSVEHTVP